ncbi:hypothetical protein ACHAXT_007755 [Thalassiosira profunda]
MKRTNATPGPSEGRPNKRLRFSAVSQLIITDAGAGDWYRKNEIDGFKRDARLLSKALRETRTAKIMKHLARSAAVGSPPPEIHVRGKEAIRGLEHMIEPCVLNLLLKRRRQLIAAVLEEQRAQRALYGKAVDHNSTAEVSETASSFARESGAPKPSGSFALTS